MPADNEDLLKVLNPSLGVDPLDTSDIPGPLGIREVRGKLVDIRARLKIASADETPLPRQAQAGKSKGKGGTGAGKGTGTTGSATHHTIGKAPPYANAKAHHVTGQTPGQKAGTAKAPGLAAVVGGPARLRLSQACQDFAHKRPDAAEAAKSPVMRWDRIVGMRLSMQLLRTGTGLFEETAGESAIRLSAKLTAKNDVIRLYADDKAGDPETPPAQADLYSILYNNQALMQAGVDNVGEQRTLGRKRRQAVLKQMQAATDLQSRQKLTVGEVTGTLPTDAEVTEVTPAPARNKVK